MAEQADDVSGNTILRNALTAGLHIFGSDLSAAFALGSLAHGGFSPLVSDVDLMLVLGKVDNQTAAQIDQVQRQIRAAPNDLAQRLSIFWSDWAAVRHGVGEIGRLPEVDRLDLLDSGRLLYGMDRRGGARRPDRATIVHQAVDFAMSKFDGQYLDRLRSPAALIAEGPRAVTKTVLFPVRFLYTLATGEIGRNEEAVRWFAAEREHADLAEAALAWRRNGIVDVRRADALLTRHLLPIYTMFVHEHLVALDTLGAGSLMTELAAWGEQITEATPRRSPGL